MHDALVFFCFRFKTWAFSGENVNMLTAFLLKIHSGNFMTSKIHDFYCRPRVAKELCIGIIEYSIEKVLEETLEFKNGFRRSSGFSTITNTVFFKLIP